MCKFSKQQIISLFLWLAVLGTSHAQTELRDYQVLVNGKDSGSLSVKYSPENAESARIEIRSRITCKVLFVKYTYEIHAVEFWTNRSLAAVESIVDDNGSRTQLSLRTKNSVQLLRVNKTNWHSTACAATTTVVMLPDIESNSKVHLLDVDSGELLETTWKYQGFDTIDVSNKAVSCPHFKVAGGLSSDIWFDDQRRLVKQTIRESGYEITVQQIQ